MQEPDRREMQQSAEDVAYPEVNSDKSDSIKELEELTEEEQKQASAEFKRKKYKALYQARTIISKIGTMQERNICGRQLKRMQKLGIAAL